ncbi:hypothetical protein SeKA_A4746 [Salmonella enterica subsp. enterica serovar Kentucky str. CVM29188]|nr:hypothetical protein SeKA_A4746 [Salmonella enterica subsp. enterica serovar Kentucky str. CVM29188]EDZ20182.1 hypothetical protein SeKB_A0514 [Salmonella enterica subsp. enterica serovar Kentucky str. CDC 191]
MLPSGGESRPLHIISGDATSLKTDLSQSRPALVPLDHAR